MKKLSCFVLMLALILALCAGARAEDAEPMDAEILEQDVPVSLDLDGDGAPERVCWSMAPGEYDDQLALTVEPEGGEALVFHTDILWGCGVYAADMDGDGVLELLLSGDVMSDDYITLALHYEDGALQQLDFIDINRGDNTDETLDFGYGKVVAIDGNALTLSGSQDVLGTWFAERTLTLVDGERFEAADNGLWQREVNLDDEDLWAYAGLTTIAPISYTDAHGNAAALEAGDKIIIIASDKVSTAWFVTRGGEIGCVDIAPDAQRGWGMLVNGVPEDEVFEYLPYAD